MTVSVTPTLGGPQVLEGLMFMENRFWFDQEVSSPQQWASKNVAVSSSFSASIDTSTFPTTWTEGLSQTFNVTVTNNGTQTWPAGGTTPVQLNLHFSPYQGGSSVENYWLTSSFFSLPADLPAGGTVTIPVTLTPNFYGHEYLEAVMIKNGDFWFDEMTTAPQAADPLVLVGAASWNASIDTSTFPTTWTEGVPQTFNVTVKNNGNVTWNASGPNPVQLDLHFSPYTGGTAMKDHWLSSDLFSLPADVAPGGSATISVTLVANFYGHEYLEGVMIKNGDFWFDQVTGSPPQWADPFVLVSPGSWNGSIDTSTFPTTWVKGQAQTFQVKVTNNGNVTWTSTGFYEVDLDLHFASYPGGSAKQAYWLTSNAFALPSDVAPGQSVMVTVTLTPNFFGHEVLEGLMVKEHQFWFDQVTTSPAQWAYVSATVTATWNAARRPRARSQRRSCRPRSRTTSCRPS